MNGSQSFGGQVGGNAGRAQSNLLALVVALVLLSIALTASIAVVDAAFTSAERDATERAVATGASERLVAADGPLADRQNVLNGTLVASFDDESLDEHLPAAETRAIAVSIDERELAAVGRPGRGTTVRRVVLVESKEAVERTPTLAGDRATIPVRTERIALAVRPTNATVETVRANDRVVLHDEDGLDGEYDVDVSRYETVTLRFEGNGSLTEGDVRLTYDVTTDRKAVLSVTVDERSGPWVEDEVLTGTLQPSTIAGVRFESGGDRR